MRIMSLTPSIHRTVLQCEQLEDRLALDGTSYVKSLYQNLLNRSADSSGLAFYVNELNNGFTNIQVAQQIWGSPEHRGVEVDSYYQLFLGRSADANGRAFWVNQMVSGAMNELQVEVQFTLSGEFMAAHNNPTAYINALYLDFLGRTPSLNEQSFWQGALQTFGAGTVSASIVTSTESFTDIIGKDYVKYLNRFVDLNGLANWLSQLQTGQGTVESVAEGIIGSAEYASHH
jgi:hypothetical protein